MAGEVSRVVRRSRLLVPDEALPRSVRSVSSRTRAAFSEARGTRTRGRPRHTAVVASRAPRLAARKPARSHTAAPGTRLAVWGVMAIVYLAFMFGPLLGTAAGYLVGGITGATAGFVIPMGPLVVAWLFGGR